MCCCVAPECAEGVSFAYAVGQLRITFVIDELAKLLSAKLHVAATVLSSTAARPSNATKRNTDVPSIHWELPKQ